MVGKILKVARASNGFAGIHETIVSIMLFGAAIGVKVTPSRENPTPGFLIMAIMRPMAAAIKEVMK